MRPSFSLDSITAHHGDGQLVLVADTDRDAQLILSTVLRHAGYTPRHVSSGDDLLQESRKGVALIVGRIMLDHANGACAIQALKGDPATANIPVIAYSLYGRDEDAAWARHAGADVFMRSVFTVSALFEALGTLPMLRSGDPLVMVSQRERSRDGAQA